MSSPRSSAAQASELSVRPSIHASPASANRARDSSSSGDAAVDLSTLQVEGRRASAAPARGRRCCRSPRRARGPAGGSLSASSSRLELPVRACRARSAPAPRDPCARAAWRSRAPPRRPAPGCEVADPPGDAGRERRAPRSAPPPAARRGPLRSARSPSAGRPHAAARPRPAPSAPSLQVRLALGLAAASQYALHLDRDRREIAHPPGGPGGLVAACERRLELDGAQEQLAGRAVRLPGERAPAGVLERRRRLAGELRRRGAVELAVERRRLVEVVGADLEQLVAGALVAASRRSGRGARARSAFVRPP